MYGILPYMFYMSMPTDTARLEARLPTEVYALLKRAAKLQGRTLTDFVVAAASDAARRAIEEMEIIRLSGHDQRIVAESLLYPPHPVPALVEATKRYSKFVKNL